MTYNDILYWYLYLNSSYFDENFTYYTKEENIMNLRKFIMILQLVSLVCIFTGCNQENKDVKEKASKVINAFSTGDMNKITEFLYASDQIEMDDELADEFGFASKNNRENGVLEQIFKRTIIEIDSVEKETVTYKVKAPDMSDIFSDIQENEKELTNDNFADYLTEYIEDAKISEITVKVTYTMEDGEFDADYKSEEFMNAITGGLLESYQEIYQEMLDDYRNGLGD
ncbi:MAG: hypothetical protein K0R92_2073 [Lachnospiraceae bacterium]|jgi:hypothetical protein|nr:hypothetical protein [Anaerocolumna sp.]MDF2610599.1 hypothetical protein [Lachnospiraceae bacterium]